MNYTKMKTPTVLLSLLPISIIIGSGVSLLNVILFGLYFIFIYFSKNNIKIEDSKSVLLLLVLYLYLIFNSLISLDISSGIYRNFGFVRFILFFLMINYLFFINEKSSNVLKIWSIIFFIVLIDIYIERYTGSNIFGLGKIEINGIRQEHGPRVTSFFRNEPIAGAFICGFSFIVLGFILSFLKSSKKLKILGFIIILVCLAGIMVTGERSNGLKALIGLLIFISIIDYVNLKNRLFVFLAIITIFFFLVNFSDYIKYRYIDQFYSKIKTQDDRENFLNNSLYFKLYQVFMFSKTTLGLVLEIKTIELKHVMLKKFKKSIIV